MAPLLATVALAALATLPAVGEPAELRCRLADSRIDESSGVDAASWSDEVVFTHNDSGDSARFFAVDTRSCATLASYTVRQAANEDWEDMARSQAGDGTPVLWLADIGDNGADRSSVVVYEVAEPGPSAAGGAVPIRSKWTLTYPDGARDAETLLVDPETGRPVVVSKDRAAGRSTVYRAPAAGSGVLERLATIDVRALDGGGVAALAWSVTGGGTSPDRRSVVLRSYLGAWVWSGAPGESLAAMVARPPRRLELPLTRQAEAVAFTRDGKGLWLTSEGEGEALHLLSLEAAAADPAAPTTTATPAGRAAPAPPAPAGGDGLGPVVAVAAGGVLLAIAAVGAGAVALGRRRRSPS